MKRTAAILTIAFLVGFVGHTHPGSGIAVDAMGRVFFVAGPVIVMIGTNGVAHTLHLDATHEKFHQLHHIQPCPDGGMVTASDYGNGLWRFAPDGSLIRFHPPPDEDRPLKIGLGGDPFAVDRQGNVYAVNAVQYRFTQILKVTREGRISSVAGGDWGYRDGPGNQAQFKDLHGGSMQVAPDGALLLSEDGARIRRIAPDGLTTTVAGGAERGFADGPGSEARFDGASGLAIEASGHILIAENSGRIRRISPDGRVTTFAGSGSRGSNDGPLATARFDAPTGIAVAPDPTQGIFVFEPEALRVRKISAGQVTTLHTGIP